MRNKLVLGAAFSTNGFIRSNPFEESNKSVPDMGGKHREPYLKYWFRRMQNFWGIILWSWFLFSLQGRKDLGSSMPRRKVISGVVLHWKSTTLLFSPIFQNKTFTKEARPLSTSNKSSSGFAWHLPESDSSDTSPKPRTDKTQLLQL